MDRLLECTRLYNNLLDIKFKVILGRKNVETPLTISFSKDEYHHLIGLHKLKDRSNIRTKKRSVIFDEILNGNISYSSISNSAYINEIDERLEAILHIGDFFNGEINNTFFRFYSRNLPFYSSIDADYLIHYTNSADNIYLFLKKDTLTTDFKPNSIFFKKSSSYEQGQTRYTLLSLSKVCSGNEETIFINPVYRHQDD